MAEFSRLTVSNDLDNDQELRFGIEDERTYLTVAEAKALRKHIKTVLKEAGY